MSDKGIRKTITFSCDPDFKELIIKKVEELGYQNKSQMIRDALQNLFESETALNHIKDNATITAIISLVYNHNDLGTVQLLLEAQHNSEVSYSYHHHMQQGECLENLIVHEEAKTIRELLKKFRSISGIKYISIQVI